MRLAESLSREAVREGKVRLARLSGVRRVKRWVRRPRARLAWVVTVLSRRERSSWRRLLSDGVSYDEW